MCGDGGARVRLENRLTAEPRLEEHEAKERNRRPLERATPLDPSECGGDHTECDEADERCSGAMDPLKPRLVVVEWRDDLSVAEWPIGAAHS